MNIAEWLNKGKEALAWGGSLLGLVPRDVLVVALLVLSASASFGLGYLTGKDAGKGSDFSVSQTPLSDAMPASATTAISERDSEAQNAPAGKPAGGQYVASKSGSKYYLPWCGGVKAIKDANKVWFASKPAAEAAGYTPAANCKGI